MFSCSSAVWDEKERCDSRWDLKRKDIKILERDDFYFRSDGDKESVSQVVSGCVVLRPDSLSASLNLICTVCFCLNIKDGAALFILRLKSRCQEKVSQLKVREKRTYSKKSE